MNPKDFQEQKRFYVDDSPSADRFALAFVDTVPCIWAVLDWYNEKWHIEYDGNGTSPQYMNNKTGVFEYDFFDYKHCFETLDEARQCFLNFYEIENG